MTLQFTPLGVSLAVVGLALVSLSVEVVRARGVRGDVSRRLAAALLAAVGGWGIASALQVSGTTLAASLFFAKLSVAAAATVPPLWLAYVCSHTGRRGWLSVSVFGPLVAAGAALVGGAATNELHYLFWGSVRTADSSLTAFGASRGPLFDLFVVYLFVPVALATILLAATAIATRGVIRAQATALAIVSIAPAVAGLAYLADATFVTGIALAGLSAVAAAGAAVLGLARYRWFDLAPVARDRVVDAMAEAMVVVGPDGDVLDHNDRAAALFVGTPGDDFVGRPVEEVAPALDELAATRADGGASGMGVASERVAADTDTTRRAETAAADERDGPGGRRGRFAGRDVTETTLETAEGRRCFEVIVTPTEVDDGTVFLLHDVTARVDAESGVAARSEMMERLVGVVRDLSAATETETIYERAVTAGTDLIGVDHCRLVDEDAETLLASTAETTPFSDVLSTTIAARVAERGRSHVVEDLSVRGGAVAAPADSPLAGGVNAGGHPTASRGDEETESEPGGDAEPILETAFSSLLSIPVEGVGVLQVFAREREAFDDDDAETLTLLAAHVSTAVDRAETEAELRGERDRLEEFASVVSHDLRNPLSVASGYLELVREDQPPDPDHLDRIERAHTRMDALLDDLLRLARHGRVIGETDVVDLQRAVREAWEAVETEDATLRIEGDLGTVVADDTRLVEAFCNLFRNSVEHGATADEGRASVTVSVARDGDRVVVADDGPGISAEMRDRVFERGVTTADHGTGFGLAIVREIADAHGWEVEAGASETGGARFDFVGVS